MAIALRELTRPTPTELNAPISAEGVCESPRQLFCVHYDGCLNEAVKRGWNSWTCARCPLAKTVGKKTGGIELYATQRR